VQRVRLLSRKTKKISFDILNLLTVNTNTLLTRQLEFQGYVITAGTTDLRHRPANKVIDCRENVSGQSDEGRN